MTYQAQIPDFVQLEDRLDNSLQRDLMKMEHVRMRIAHEPVTSDLVDMELIELKFIFDRRKRREAVALRFSLTRTFSVHHDNRDFAIIPNYQPRSQKSFHEQTLLFDQAPGASLITSCCLILC